jgi:CHAT domain-containing protein
MGYQIEEEGMIRRYLLGRLAEDERQQLEEKIMANNELFNRVLLAEDEMVEEYVQGELSESERAGFEASFLSTPDGRKQVSFAKALSEYVSRASASEGHATTETAGEELERVTEEAARASKVSRPVWWIRPALVPYFRLAAAAVIVVGLGLGIWRVFFYQSEVSKGIAALAQAYREQRPLEARISGFKYAPAANTRGEQAKADQVALDRAERILLDAVFEHPGPASHHALGRLYLAERQFDKAIVQFEEALKVDPNNAQLHSDFGAALLEKGKVDLSANDSSGKGFEELAKSLGHLNRALELDDSRLEALFNRALVHTQMALPDQAEEDWRHYLERDSNSAWASEAKRNLRSLEDAKGKTSRSSGEILEDFLEAYESRNDEKAWGIISHSGDALSGTIIWEQLVDKYLEASFAGRTGDAIKNLQALSYVGELESKRAGDAYISGLAEFYKSSSQGRLERVTQARQLTKLGRQSFIEGKFPEANDTFNKSKQGFVASGDRWEAEYVEHWIGYCYLQSSLTQQSQAILNGLVPRLERENHKWLLMRTLHLLSGAEYNLGIYSRAIDHNLRSLALAEEIGNAIGAFNASSILAEQYRYIDNGRKSLGCIEASLSSLDSCALTPSQVAQHYAITASSLMSSGLYPAAIDYQKEALRRALAVGRPRTITIAYTRLGQIYGRAGNYSEGIDNARLAYETAKSFSDEGVRNTMMALSSLAIGDLYREGQNFNEAIDSYNEALGFYDKLDFQYGVYEAHKNRLLCYLAKGEDSAANEELKTTLSLIEKHRSTILDGDNRNNFFDNAQSVYDIAIDFAFSRMHNQERAFEYSEESRSRSLLDSVRGDARLSGAENNRDIVFNSFSQPLKLAELNERLPKQAQIIQYAVLNDKILICVLSKARPLLVVAKEIPQYELNEKVRNYLQILTGGSEIKTEQASGYANELFDWLIRPVEDLLDKSKPLYIVPDKILNYLPFGALRSSDSKTFFIEDYVPVISPSSSLLVVCSEIAAKKRGAEVEKILSVGNPRIDRSEFPGLGNLPSAAAEANEVARYYESRCVLVGDAAREGRVRTEMQRADVIHLAVHSVLDERWPLHSKLLLTRESNEPAAGAWSDGVLEAQEVYGLDLSRAKVALLSACQTGVARYYGGEGMISFARPFLSRGVPLVVVSLWKVEDEATRKLMASVHKHRKHDNVSTAEALVLAQREMISKTDENVYQPYSWASFIAIGGSTTF